MHVGTTILSLLRLELSIGFMMLKRTITTSQIKIWKCKCDLHIQLHKMPIWNRSTISPSRDATWSHSDKSRAIRTQNSHKTTHTQHRRDGQTMKRIRDGTTRDLRCRYGAMMRTCKNSIILAQIRWNGHSGHGDRVWGFGGAYIGFRSKIPKTPIYYGNVDFPYKIDVFRRSACGLYFRILIAQIEYTHDEEYKHTKNGELADMTHGAVLTPENPEKMQNRSRWSQHTRIFGDPNFAGIICNCYRAYIFGFCPNVNHLCNAGNLISALGGEMSFLRKFRAQLDSVSHFRSFCAK